MLSFESSMEAPKGKLEVVVAVVVVVVVVVVCLLVRRGRRGTS